MGKRKIVQIVHMHPKDSCLWDKLYAVCSDGTVWSMELERGRDFSYTGSWLPLPPIPQSEDTDNG